MIYSCIELRTWVANTLLPSLLHLALPQIASIRLRKPHMQVKHARWNLWPCLGNLGIVKASNQVDPRDARLKGLAFRDRRLADLLIACTFL